MKQTPSVQYYRNVKVSRPDLRVRMRDIAHTRVRYGYRRIHMLLKRDGWRLGENQLYRIYREEQLQLCSKLPKRRKMVVTRRERIRPGAANEVWSLVFSAGRRTRFARWPWWMSSVAKRWPSRRGQRLGDEHVVAMLSPLVARR